MRRHALTHALPSTAFAAVAAIVVAGCCVCPKSGKLMPCERVPGSGGGTAAAAPLKPRAVGGTEAPALEGAPEAWVALPGVTVTGQPGDDAWAAYGAAGYRTVVNFRPSAEGADRERSLVVGNGMQYFHVPVTGADIAWGDSNALAKLLANPNNRPLLLHCSSGNRVAGVWALYQHRHEGLPPEAAIAEGQRIAPMKPNVEKRLREMLGID